MQMWYLQKSHQFFMLIVDVLNSTVNFDAYIVKVCSERDHKQTLFLQLALEL